jgi:hypothetical protein
MAFKLKGFPLMDGTKPMKMKKDAAMKMKKAAMQLKKEEAAMKLMKEKESAMKMGHSPKKAAAKPDFLDLDKDGDKTESMKEAAADKKNPAMQMKSAMKLKGEAMKMKTPMKKEGTKKGRYKGFPIEYPANMTLQEYIQLNKAELDKMVSRGK